MYFLKKKKKRIAKQKIPFEKNKKINNVPEGAPPGPILTGRARSGASGLGYGSRSWLCYEIAVYDFAFGLVWLLVLVWFVVTFGFFGLEFFKAKAIK